MASVSEQPLHMLVVHPDVPPEDRDACSTRLFRMLEIFAAAGHRVTMLGRGGFDQHTQSARLLGAGVAEVIPFDVVRLSEAQQSSTTRWLVPPLDLVELFRRGRFDVAWLSLYEIAEQYAPLIRALSPATRIIVDSTDVHWVREHRGATLTGDPIELARAKRTREREQAAYQSADVLVAISDADAAAMHELAPAVPLGTVPIIQAFEPVVATPADREGLIFVANFNHAPNVDAALHFHTEVWPLLKRALPDVTLTLAGHAPPPEVKALAAPDVTVTGWVPEIEPYLDSARISIVPLRWGAGMKGKIGQAAAAGVPVVTTTVGAEGMRLRDGEHVLIADAPQAFCDAIVRLHGDDDLWGRLALSAHAHLSELLGTGAARAAVENVLDLAAPPRWQIAADAAQLPEVIAEYVQSFEAGSGATLLLTVAPDAPDGPGEAFTRASAIMAQLGVDPDSAADIDIVAWDDRVPVPARTVTFPRSPAEPARAEARRPDVAVVVQGTGDARVLRAQLDALESARTHERAEIIVIAALRDAEVDALVADLAHARVLRCERATGWTHALALALDATTAPTVVTLGPIALPQGDFLSPLLAALADGAAIAGATVDGACGLRIAADGSLWPRDAGEGGAADALALDCLAAKRTTWAQLPKLALASGPLERRLAAWAAPLGRLHACRDSLVQRYDAGPLSAIVCTRDRPRELTDAVGLLVAGGVAAGQNEVIIVDSSAEAPARDVARRLAAEHDRVRYVRVEEAGLLAARSAGAAAAHNAMLSFLHDDARPLPGWREHVVRSLSRPDVVAVAGPVCSLWPEALGSAPSSDALAGNRRLHDLGEAEHDLTPPLGPHGANYSILASALSAAGGFRAEAGDPAPVRGERALAWRLGNDRVGLIAYDGGAAVGHLTGPADLDRAANLRHCLIEGVENARLSALRDGASRDRLVAQASDAAARLLKAIPLRGAVTLDGAVEIVARTSSLPGVVRAHAARLLGLLAGSALLLDEQEILVGGLQLRLAAGQLDSIVAATPGLAVPSA